MKSFGFAALAACSLFAVSCASDQIVDELAGPEEVEPADGKGDISEGGVHTYYEITRDMRKCSFPMCSGFFLDRLNASSTKCHDGSSQERCYTPELDMSESGLSAAALDKLSEAAAQSVLKEGVHAIVRGRFAKKNLTTPQPTLGRFVVTEVWIAQSEAVSDGVFVKVRDNGVRCIAAPCASTTEKALNTSRTANIAEIDFAEAGVEDSVLEEVGFDMFEPHGVIVVGDRYNFQISGRKGKGRTATAVYRKMRETNDAACFVGGCSGQVCSDQEGVITTCEFRPEFACFQDATCERQADGGCGWTETAELQTCLAAPPPL
ncbi:MAG: hypothetical protein H0V17_36390 [Deltaproteobacteria bacterium]|nr:hypothetical protein [Deltaproteobacteria bacterium]